MAANYPITTFHFQVDFGAATISFTECSGLDSATAEVIKYRTGDSPFYNETCFPGRISYSEITLKRGIFNGNDEFYDWFNTLQMDTIERRTVTITLLNEDHNPIRSWVLDEAWPSKVTGPSLNSTGNDFAIEEMTIQHEGITQADVSASS